MPPPYPPPPGGGFPPPVGTPPPAFGAKGTLQDFLRNAQTVVTKPAVASFDAAKSFAGWNTILLTVGIASGIRGVLGAISSRYVNAAVFGFGKKALVAYNPVSIFAYDTIGTFIGFFIGVGILYLIARAFKGTGDFLTYAHALALISVPVTAISAVLGLIPILGGLAAMALGIYAIYLAILATVSTHQLPMDRAVWVVLIPVLVGAVLAFCVIAAASAALIALTHAG